MSRFFLFILEGVTFHSLLVICWNLLVACTRCKITHYFFKNLLVTRCRSCSLQNLTRYPLQDLLVPCWRSCLLQKPLVTCCKIRSLLVAEVAGWKYLLVTLLNTCSKIFSLHFTKFPCYSLEMLLLAKNYSSLVTKKPGN